MSLASDYAAAEAATNATVPTPWTGPGGLLTATVLEDGSCLLVVSGRRYPVPGVVLLSFAAWVNSTFG